MAEETPTIADLPHHRAGASAPAPPSAHEATNALPGPNTVLRDAEFEQTRLTALMGMLFNCIGLVTSPLVGGEPTAWRIYVAALALGLVNNAWLWQATRRRERYEEWTLLAYFSVAPIPNAGVVYYLGVFGPIVAMFVLNIYTTCLGYNRRIARITLAGSIAPFVVLATLISAGWITDPGLMTATAHLGAAGHVVAIGSFIAFVCLVYAQARRTRELMVASLVERDEAVRRASHREALFLEARQDLERALHAGGLGRFTDQTLGSFKLGVVLGRGGMGEVYEATHVATGEPAAVKMLLPEVLGRPDFVRRFLREVRIAASLDSPHVVRVIEVGDDETAPLPYLAMERLYGEDLAQILRREERLLPETVVELVGQVGRGLGVATRAGIVHRDLKPQNLFRCAAEPPVWKILDFGVSKLVERGSTLTHDEAVGTPHYMAPEQARGGDVGPATDLYAVGAIAYRALTGHQPFAGDAAAEVLVATLSTMPVRPTALARLPRDVDLMLAIAMAKQPGDRFASPEQLTAALEAALRGALDEPMRRRAERLLAAQPWAEPDL